MITNLDNIENKSGESYNALKISVITPLRLKAANLEEGLWYDVDDYDMGLL